MAADFYITITPNQTPKIVSYAAIICMHDERPKEIRRKNSEPKTLIKSINNSASANEANVVKLTMMEKF